MRDTEDGVATAMDSFLRCSSERRAIVTTAPLQLAEDGGLRNVSSASCHWGVAGRFCPAKKRLARAADGLATAGGTRSSCEGGAPSLPSMEGTLRNGGAPLQLAVDVQLLSRVEIHHVF